MLREIFFFVFVLCIHELGHYVGFRIFGYRPDFGFRFGNIYVGTNVFPELTIRQAFIVTLLGILFGLLPVLMFEHNLMWCFLYYILCTIDIAYLYGFAEQKDWNIKIREAK